jgi:hypothetical protein
MKRRRDPLELSPNWHVDCRIEQELPEDNVVRTRFLVNVLCMAVAAGMLLFTGWLGYVSLTLERQIDDWERRLGEHRAEMREIQRLQREYTAEAAKIDEAYTLVRPRFQVWQLLGELGRTRPDPMAIDTIEWNDAGVVLRGTVIESSERATRLLGVYVDQLQRHEHIGRLFREIRLTDIDRGGAAGALRFEINCLLQAPRP